MLAVLAISDTAIAAPPAGGDVIPAVIGSATAATDQVAAVIAAGGTAVVGRFLFYNDSHFDGNGKGADSRDDNAIAPDKSPYLADSGAATFANVSNYSKGITGIMIDIAGPHGAITAGDFTFRVGTNNSLNTWVDGPAPTIVTVRAGAGVGGSDRVELIWTNRAIQNEWLEVDVQAGSDTGLVTTDSFFFGNKAGDTGDDGPEAYVTNAIDLNRIRANSGNTLPVDNMFDINKDGIVNSTDGNASRSNAGTLLNIDIITFVPLVPVNPNVVAVAQPFVAPPPTFFSLPETPSQGLMLFRGPERVAAAMFDSSYLTGEVLVSRGRPRVLPEEHERDVLLPLSETIIPEVEVAELSDAAPDVNEPRQLPQLRDPLRAPQAPLEPSLLASAWPWYVAIASGVALAGSMVVLYATRRRRPEGRRSLDAGRRIVKRTSVR